MLNKVLRKFLQKTKNLKNRNAQVFFFLDISGANFYKSGY